MAPLNKSNPLLTEEFLGDLYSSCLNNEYILAVMTEHLDKSMLPNKDYQALHTAITDYYKKNKKIPQESVIMQSLASSRAARSLFDEILSDYNNALPTADAMAQLETYIKQVKFQKTYQELIDLYNRTGVDAATKRLVEYSDWVNKFSLQSAEFVDITGNFTQRYVQNKEKRNTEGQAKEVVRFYIDELDIRNQSRNLRGQLSCFLAPTGVGKSHIARWVGKCACQMDGLNVLHFQLEGSEAEVIDAYSASLASCSTYKFENGLLTDKELQEIEEELKQVSGKLYVKSYPKFNSQVSTKDIHKAIQDFKRKYKFAPDIIIIDSMDLLTDASGKHYSDQGERLKRINVANDLKDLASDENVWIVVTYQSTIENQEWLNDEKNVLTAYNTAEAKGLARPLTHLITLNQSSREEKEGTMRLHVAKARFFRKGEAFRIATDYEHERFYDKKRTMNLALCSRS
jgi:replicative DNA helicase